jgi:hypothetical protein
MITFLVILGAIVLLILAVVLPERHYLDFCALLVALFALLVWWHLS